MGPRQLIPTQVKPDPTVNSTKDLKATQSGKSHKHVTRMHFGMLKFQATNLRATISNLMSKSESKKKGQKFRVFD